MDWIFFAMIGAGWMFAIMLGLQLGVRVERFRRDKEVEAFEFPEDDSDYWRRLYEELAEEYDSLPKVFPADTIVTRGDHGRGETT